VAANPNFVGTPKRGMVQIVNADGQANKTVLSAGGSGSKAVSLYAHSTDTSARDVQVAFTRSSVTFPICVVSVPANSGNTSALPPVDLLSMIPASALALDQDGQRYMLMESGDALVVSALTTVTATRAISVHCDVGHF